MSSLLVCCCFVVRYQKEHRATAVEPLHHRQSDVTCESRIPRQPNETKWKLKTITTRFSRLWKLSPKKKNPKIAFNNLPTIERRRGFQELQQGEVSKRKFSIHTSKQRFLSLHGRFLHVHSLLLPWLVQQQQQLVLLRRRRRRRHQSTKNAPKRQKEVNEIFRKKKKTRILKKENLQNQQQEGRMIRTSSVMKKKLLDRPTRPPLLLSFVHTFWSPVVLEGF